MLEESLHSEQPISRGRCSEPDQRVAPKVRAIQKPAVATTLIGPEYANLGSMHPQLSCSQVV